MGIFDKLMFWKKPEEDLGAPNNMGLDMNMPPLGQPDGLGADMTGMNNASHQNEFGLPGMNDYPAQGTNLSTMDFNSTQHSMSQPSGSSQSSSFQSNQQPFQSSQFSQQPTQNPPTLEKDIQILSLKLDAIKSDLDSINQRVKNIERIAENEQVKQQQQKRWY